MSANTSSNAVASSGSPSPGLPRSLLRLLFALVCLATLIGLFYAVENWRGKHAWGKYLNGPGRHGTSLSWNDYLPSPIPDDQNIFKAPHMQQWFVKDSDTNAAAEQKKLMSRFSGFAARENQGNGVLKLMELTVVTPGEPRAGGTPEPVFNILDPAAPAQARKLLRDAVGPVLDGAQGLIFLARAPEELKPVRAVIEAPALPPADALQTWFWTNTFSPPIGNVSVAQTGKNTFDVSIRFLPACSAAADYLAWSQQLEPDLEMLRTALKRPYAQMAGDYRLPFAVPVPHFVAVRNVAQNLAQRAQCSLLLGQPEAAVRDLTLLNDLRRLLEDGPEHKPMTLVATMIDVALAGLYTEVIADGLRLGAWRDPQLEALQQQLSRIELLPLFTRSMAAERAGVCHLLQNVPPAVLNEIFGISNAKTVWDKLKRPDWLIFRLVPRGWRYQNMATVAALEQEAIECFDLTNRCVAPKKADAMIQLVQGTFKHRSPYTFLAAIAVPNFTRAAQSLSRNESLVRQGLVACALERHRLATGTYPETLDTLVPSFLQKIPADTICDQPLRYRRTETGFLLYSLGWNEKDDNANGGQSVSDADWVWKGK